MCCGWSPRRRACAGLSCRRCAGATWTGSPAASGSGAGSCAASSDRRSRAGRCARCRCQTRSAVRLTAGRRRLRARARTILSSAIRSRARRSGREHPAPDAPGACCSGARHLAHVPRFASHVGTQLAADGVPARTIQGWFGHEHASTTDRYVHYARRDDEVAMLNRAFTPAR